MSETTKARSRWRVYAGIAGALLLLSGCARAHAKAAPDMPPLDVPAPPPRDIEPVDMDAPAPVPLPDEPEHRTPQRTRTPPRPEPPRAEPPKPEPPKIEPPPEPAKEEPPKPASPLQTTPSAADTEIERRIRSTMAKATNDLSRIDYRSLNVDAKRQYDMAKGFVRQAEKAIQDHNLVFARDLADKAADLAVQLGGKR
ncbi:MAG TPA: hypothetical protein VL309_07540 [Vicinamibacterales bacterium]|jgi:hypothetical protein|nr:hypothetical protein [Vicinamibacterales bacterium]